MNENHPAQLYRMVRIALSLGASKSIWLKYDGKTVLETGSRPMEIAG